MGVNSNRVTECKRCGEQICFFKHDRAWVAVEATTVERGDDHFDDRRHLRHHCIYRQEKKYETTRRPIGR